MGLGERNNGGYNVPDDGDEQDNKKVLPHYSPEQAAALRKAFTDTPSPAPSAAPEPEPEAEATPPPPDNYPGFGQAITNGAASTQTSGSVPILRGKTPPAKMRAAPKKPTPEDDYQNPDEMPTHDENGNPINNTNDKDLW